MLRETPPPTPSPTAAVAPAPPSFCADVTDLGGENPQFDFRGCSLPCSSPRHEDCPDGMLCALTNDCPT